jgi:peptidoglycan/xylan/chitin deacetylase (PgdA/CDA1 family)
MAEPLTLGPAWVQTAKPVLTRTRTALWRARGSPARPGLRILFYHRVADEPDPLAVSRHGFAAQMDALAAEGHRVVDVITAADLLARGERGDGVVALSFDDGYRDVAEHGLPHLERLGFRATVFVATGVLDGTAAFTWYERQPPVLSWSEVVDLDRGSALSFEAHTITHPNLRALDGGAARTEIAGSKAALEDRLGRAVRGFCYPAGIFGPRERALVAAAGFTAATSCEPGANSPASDLLALRRIPVDARDRLADFRAKVQGGHDRPSLLRGVYRRARYGAASRA